MTTPPTNDRAEILACWDNLVSIAEYNGHIHAAVQANALRPKLEVLLAQAEATPEPPATSGYIADVYKTAASQSESVPTPDAEARAREILCDMNQAWDYYMEKAESPRTAAAVEELVRIRDGIYLRHLLPLVQECERGRMLCQEYKAKWKAEWGRADVAIHATHKWRKAQAACRELAMRLQHANDGEKYYLVVLAKREKRAQAAESECDRLRDALTPFAIVAQLYINHSPEQQAYIEVKYLIAARDALNGAAPGKEVS